MNRFYQHLILATTLTLSSQVMAGSQETATKEAQVMAKVKPDVEKDIKQKPKPDKNRIVKVIIKYIDTVKSGPTVLKQLPINWIDISDNLGTLYFCRTAERGDLKLWRADARQNTRITFNSQTATYKVRWRKGDETLPWPMAQVPVETEQLYTVEHGEEVAYIEFHMLPETKQDDLLDHFILLDQHQCTQQAQRLLHHQILK